MFDIASQRPQFTAVDAIQIAAEKYGRTVIEARQLPSERDQNFLLREASGVATVIKIAGAAEEGDILDLQNKVMEHLIAGDQPNRQPVERLFHGHRIKSPFH